LKILPVISLCILLAGCATEYSPMPTPVSGSAAPVPPAPTVKKQGIYHKVLAGQTLWQIAQEYGVNIQDIIDSNNIPNGSKLEVGQLLFIPGVSHVMNFSNRVVDNNKSAFTWPVIGKVIAYFDDPLGANAVNHGIDIKAQAGDDVHATREGTVILADYMTGYGDTVMIDHGDGFISVYARNSKLLVRPGEHVYKGDVIARVGSQDGRTVEHFEIRRGAQATNPLYYLP
ncbi:MAG: peptidoglycan DD-metalloendopeptidase family protein, partial [Candidatus Omnitrophica bacterium]|nr:peptidoglycan DD-metalloendopeptidase family protein [Candidatus Omnitrophota bacterium]